MTDQEGSNGPSPVSGYVGYAYNMETNPLNPLSDSSYFFSERRLSQLFNVDAWTNDEGLRDEDHRDPPPEPAPRASYCPPSPATAHAPSLISQNNLTFVDYATQHHQFASHHPGIKSDPTAITTRSKDPSLPVFSDDVALGMSRLSKLSSGSNLTEEEEEEEDEEEGDDDRGGGRGGCDRLSFPYSRSSTIGDDNPRYSRASTLGSELTPKPGSPASCQPGSSARFSGLSQLTADSLKSARNSRSSSSLPSVLSELVGEVGGVNDLFGEDPMVLSRLHAWNEDVNDNDINWQERCYELELSLQRFRDQAGKIRELLREKLAELEQRVIEAESRAHSAERKNRMMEKQLDERKATNDEDVRRQKDSVDAGEEVPEEIISTLSSQIAEQRLLRMEDAKKVEAKAAKIKEWVTNKLKELEDQNAVLREQNAKCNIQLELLRGRLAHISTLHNGKDAENNAYRSSNENLADRIHSESAYVPSRPSTLGRNPRTKSRSPGSLRRASSSDTDGRYDELKSGHRHSISRLEVSNGKRISKVDIATLEMETPQSLSPKSPLEAMLNSLTQSTGSLPRKMPSSPASSRKPVPQPRTKNVPLFADSKSPNHFVKSIDSLDLELETFNKPDSIDSSHLGRSFEVANCVDGRVSRAKDEIHDYSEIYTPNNEMGPWTDKPPTPPLHRFPSWESRIYQVAQQGLSMADLGSDDRLNRHSSGLGSYPEIHVPVYAAVKGRASQIRSMPFTGDSSDSSDGEDHCGGGLDSVGRLSCSRTPSSNESSSSSPSKSKTSSLSPAKHSGSSPSKSVRRDISFESGMSDDYAIPPDARSETVSIESTHAPTMSARTSCIDTTTNTLTSSNHFSPYAHNVGSIVSPRGETSLEKMGYLTKLGGKLKTWKKRYFILKDGSLSYWKSQSEIQRKPAGEISLDHGCIVTRSEGAHTFEVNTGKKIYYLTADSTTLVEEWVRVLQNVLRRNATRLLLSREDNTPTIKGWLTKVKHGHAKQCWCVLIGKMFVYFKNPSDQNPLGQINMRDTRVEEVDRVSDSEGEENSEEDATREDLTIGLFPSHQGPSYLICPNKHDKDSWLYHLTVVSGGGSNIGTQYEQLIQKLMELDGDANCVLWRYPLLLYSKEPITSPFTTLHTQLLQTEAIKLFKSCQLYTSVLMDPSAIDYHVVLCQNALHLCLTQPELQAELFCSLVKQTSVHLQPKPGVQVTKTLNKIKHSRNLLLCATQSLFLCDSSGAQKASPTLGGSGIVIDPKINPPIFTFTQGWQFLSLAVSLFVPKNNKLLWYLKVHLQRNADTKSEIGKYAIYCQRALQRAMDNGGREAKPSRMEVLSILLKNPYHHSLPHAIPVHFLNGTYQVVGFDGSTTIDEFVCSLNQEIQCRDVHQSGFALFSDDPIEKDLEHCLHPTAKLCDVISKWETALREKGSGKFENTKVIRLLYKNRLYWKYASKHETDKEKLLLGYQINEQIQQCKFPVTKELALELTTLLAQIDMGEVNTERSRGSDSGGPSFAHVQQAFIKFYPKRYKDELKDDEKKLLWDSLQEKWLGLRGRNQADCVRILLTCARKWPFFGAILFPATTTYPDVNLSGSNSAAMNVPDIHHGAGKVTQVWVAVSEEAVTLLEKTSMQPIVRYHYGNVVTFGGCQEDFMLVVHTPEEESTMHPPGTHKLLLCMSKPKILELTLLIADYMNALGRAMPGTPQAGTLTRHGSNRSCRGGPFLPHQISCGQPDLLQMTTEIDKKDPRKRAEGVV